VARETGRTISFAGSPRLSVWPELAIELRNVELSNPPEMLEGRFAAADTVRLKLSGASLWRGSPEIAQVVVTRPRINLLVDVEGRSNFAFERDGEPDARCRRSSSSTAASTTSTSAPAARSRSPTST
jgi:AsmA protein